MSYDTFQLGANSTPVDLEISWLQLDGSESAGTREPWQMCSANDQVDTGWYPIVG